MLTHAKPLCLSTSAPVPGPRHFVMKCRFGKSRWIEAEREETLRGGSSKGGESIGDVVHREETIHAFGAGPRKCPGAVSVFGVGSGVRDQ